MILVMRAESVCRQGNFHQLCHCGDSPFLVYFLGRRLHHEDWENEDQVHGCLVEKQIESLPGIGTALSPATGFVYRLQ